MSCKILVSGATGALGGLVAREAAAAGHAVRAAARDADKVVRTLGEGFEVVELDYRRQGTLARALDSVDAAFLVWPPMDPDSPRWAGRTVDAVRAAGVGRVVHVSILGADQNPDDPMFAVEKIVEESGLDHVHLRPNLFMQDFLGPLARPGGEEGVIPLPAGEGRVSFVDARDVAAVAVESLEGSTPGALELTGPRPLDHHQVATLISQVCGTTVRYLHVDAETYLDEMVARGVPEPSVRYMASVYRAVREGWMATVTDTVRSVLGRPPRGFEQFARDHARRFAVSSRT